MKEPIDELDGFRFFKKKRKKNDTDKELSNQIKQVWDKINLSDIGEKLFSKNEYGDRMIPNIIASSNSISNGGSIYLSLGSGYSNIPRSILPKRIPVTIKYGDFGLLSLGLPKDGEFFLYRLFNIHTLNSSPDFKSFKELYTYFKVNEFKVEWSPSTQMNSSNKIILNQQLYNYNLYDFGTVIIFDYHDNLHLKEELLSLKSHKRFQPCTMSEYLSTSWTPNFIGSPVRYLNCEFLKDTNIKEIRSYLTAYLFANGYYCCFGYLKVDPLLIGETNTIFRQFGTFTMTFFVEFCIEI